MRFVPFIFILNFIFSCGSAAVIPIDTEKSNLFDFKLSFISFGEGIDLEAKQTTDFYIQDYEKRNKIKLDYDIHNWKREGEIDYCFRFFNLNKSQRIYFVDELKEALKMHDRVRYNTNCTCEVHF